jgi:cytochrome c553
MHAWIPSSLLVLLSAGPAGRAAEFAPADVEFFEKKVRPILAENCHGCHSGRKRRGNLLLDSRASLLRGGDTGPAVVPGSPEKSLLVQAISYKEHLRMPPRSKLPDEQIAALTAWVAKGAPWPGGDQKTAGEEKVDWRRRLAHWAFQPVRRVEPPPVRNAGWAHNPIDRFLLAKMEQRGGSPSGEADRRAIIRRLTYDLTGLPPTPDEIRGFLADRSPDAYEKLVDRLLASPAYGERWGRHWLDLVRFAETLGHEFDYDIPHADGYRDYVIRALNEDLPYDAFVREHVAGDLLQPRRHPADGTNESILGTGFWLLGEAKHSPVDLRADGADRRDNQIDVFGKAFLGLTVACARCHDHKFDPVTTKEYYSLVSYLQSARVQQAFLDPPERIAAPAARLRSLRHEAAALAIRRSADVLERRVPELVAEGSRRAGGVSPPWGARSGDSHPPPALDRDYPLFEDFSRGDYRGWFVTGDAFGPAPAGSNDVEIDPAAEVPVRRILRGANTRAVSARLAGALRSRTFTVEMKYIHYKVRGKSARINLILDGYQLLREPIYGGLRFEPGDGGWHVQDVSMWAGLKGYIEVLDDGDGAVELEEVRFSDRREPPAEVNPSLDEKELREALRQWRDGTLTSPARIAGLNVLLKKASGGRKPPVEDAPLQALLRQIADLERSLPATRRGLALADGTPVQERVHIRGNPKTLGEEAPRQLPAIVGGSATTPPSGTGRREMAERLTSADNPLLARVIVNRLWHHHFGQGLVRSTDDFGHQGERPTHPELLDWLASELVEGGWSLKRLHRLMLLCSAYRQSSRGDEASDKADPRNELLHRMPIRRLEAEAIRDALLAVSGGLDRTMFGRGPAPYLTEFMIGRGRPASSGPLNGAGRRTVYLNVRRNFLPPLLTAFDYPVPFTTMGRRSVSNVPAQALALLNNPFVVGEAARWARRVAAEGGGDAERVRRMYEAAFGREATEEELRQAQAFLAEQSSGRVWADLAHVLFNVKEFIFVN